MNKATPAGQAILAVLRSRDFYRFYVLVLLFGCCTLFHYFGELVDFTGWVVKCRGRTVKLIRTEYELLAYLVSNRGKVLTHRELLHFVKPFKLNYYLNYLRL